jgi:hypothetical protein
MTARLTLREAGIVRRCSNKNVAKYRFKCCIYTSMDETNDSRAIILSGDIDEYLGA